MNTVLYYEYGKSRSSLYYNNEFFNTGHNLGNVDIYLSPDGTRMYLQVHNNYRPYQYTLTTPWDLSTAVQVRIGNTGKRAQNFYFKPDGTRYYVRTDNIGDPLYTVRSFTLSTPWNVSTMVADPVNFNPGFIPGGVRVLMFTDDGTKMYINGTGNNINQYTLSTPWEITTATFDYSANIIVNINNSTFLSSDGTSLFLANHANTISKKTLSTPYDLNTAISTKTANISSYATAMNGSGIHLKPDGTKIYHAGYNLSPGSIYAYNLKVPFEV